MKTRTSKEKLSFFVICFFLCGSRRARKKPIVLIFYFIIVSLHFFFYDRAISRHTRKEEKLGMHLIETCGISVIIVVNYLVAPLLPKAVSSLYKKNTRSFQRRVMKVDDPVLKLVMKLQLERNTRESIEN